jgi:hypothetical protein
MAEIGWTPEDWDVWMGFLRNLQPRFIPMLNHATMEVPVIHLSDDDPVHRFRLLCLMRLSWEWPDSAFFIVEQIKRGTELTPEQLELCILLVAPHGHPFAVHTHIQPCKAKYPWDTYLNMIRTGCGEKSIPSVDAWLGVGGYGGYAAFIPEGANDNQIIECLTETYGFDFKLAA